MKEEFLSYEQALALKELGFDEPCLGFYNHNKLFMRYMNPDKDWNSIYQQTLKNSKITIPSTYSAPLKQQVFRWFREKHGIDVFFRKIDYGEDSPFTGYYYTVYNNNEIIELHGADKRSKEYEGAESACIDKLIEILKTKSHDTTTMA